MLVTFRSKASGSITMFGDVALALLKMAGHSGTVPSALLAEDIPAAIARLEESLAAADPQKHVKHSAQPEQPENSGAELPVGFRLRAYPLILMLSAAAKEGCDVMWEKGASLVYR